MKSILFFALFSLKVVHFVGFFFVLSALLCRIYLRIMKLFAAIQKMRELTAQGKTFSFSFMSYNSTAGTSEGVVDVSRAKLRKRTSSDSKNADYLIAYFDCDVNEARQFYLPCLMFFNGTKISIR